MGGSNKACFGLLRMDRRGIPPGSPVSSIVSKFMMAPVLGELDGSLNDAVVVAYEDDILILTRTKREAQAHRQTLIAAFEQHPAGPFYPKHAELRRVDHGFDFLRHNFRVRYGTAYAKPLMDKAGKLVCRVMTALRLVEHLPGPISEKLAFLNDQAVQVRAWMIEHQLWKNCPGDLLLLGIDSTRGKVLAQSPIRPMVLIEEPEPILSFLPSRDYVPLTRSPYKGPRIGLSQCGFS
jgi:hypothetical protein